MEKNFLKKCYSILIFLAHKKSIQIGLIGAANKIKKEDKKKCWKVQRGCLLRYKIFRCG